MGEASSFQPGQTVVLQDGRRAQVRFAGRTHFAPGDWIGLELGDASGKNDGAVQGERYFTCAPGHGMFVRPGAATIVEQSRSKPVSRKPSSASRAAAGAGAAAGSTQSKSRPSSVASAAADRRRSLADQNAQRRANALTSPTPSARSAIISPPQSPTKLVQSRPASRLAAPESRAPTSGSTSASQAPVTATSGSRTGSALQQTSARPTRAPVASQGRAVASTETSTERKPAIHDVASPQASHTSVGEGETTSLCDHDRPSSAVLSPTASDPDLSYASVKSPVMAPTSSMPPPKSSRPLSTTDRSLTNPGQANLKREVDDLKTKLRLLEKKRLEDRDKLKALEKLQGERDRFESIIQKLQTKYQPQQQELADLRRQLQQVESQTIDNERKEAEIDSAVEMATLDREMAEETTEAYKAELDTLRQRHEELELEVDVLRQENAELTREMSPEERTSQGWLQLERTNERLKEALIRLRDVTQETEADLRDQVRDLEKDVKASDSYQRQYEDTKARLSSAEDVAESLRSQLEAALGAEEMIEELGDKNMQLTERIDEMKLTIEDLENLKELNDELEVNHVETEKQLQDEIEYHESLYAEQMRRTTAQESTIEDLEYTVAKFRDLVTNLRSDLDDMQSSQQITESEAQELNSRSKAMMDLNLRLQASASKVQIRTIDMELQRQQAQEAADELQIVRHFLPGTAATERDSVQTFLRFKRIDSKASILHGALRERLNGVAAPGHEEDTLTCCQVLDQLTWLRGCCLRFVAFIETATVEEFQRLASVLYDLEPVERAINSWLQGIKAGEIKEQQVAEELNRTHALLSHLAERYIGESIADSAQTRQAEARLMQSQLENAAAALGHIKAIAQTKVVMPTDADENAEQDAQSFLDRADQVIARIRSARVVCHKSVQQLEDLLGRSMTLEESAVAALQQTKAATTSLAETCRSSGLAMIAVATNEDRSETLTYQELAQAIGPSDTIAFEALLLATETAAQEVTSFQRLVNNASRITEIPHSSTAPPWTVLAQQLRDQSSTWAGYEHEVTRLKGELTDKASTMAVRDKTIDDLRVNVEVLERRVEESGGRRERVREMEAAIEAARIHEQELMAKLESMGDELQSLAMEREQWQQQAQQQEIMESDGQGRTRPPSLQYDPHLSLAHFEQQTAPLRAEIEMLQSMIRRLRQERQSAELRQAQLFLEGPLGGRREAERKAAKARDEPALRLARESDAVFRALAENLERPESQVVQMPRMATKDRLSWRPVRESVRWQVERQREAWESWRDWCVDVGERGELLQFQKAGRVRSKSRTGQFTRHTETFRSPQHQKKGDTTIMAAKAMAKGPVRIVEA